MDNTTKTTNLEAECTRLRLVLEGALVGFRHAYDALERNCYDEAMLHCGYHQAQVWKALLPDAGERLQAMGYNLDDLDKGV